MTQYIYNYIHPLKPGILSDIYREVFKALNKTRGLYARWQDLHALQARSGPNSVVATPTPTLALGLPMLTCREELEWTSTELRNALRSIEWDLEDLEDTIYILFIANLVLYMCAHIYRLYYC